MCYEPLEMLEKHLKLIYWTQEMGTISYSHKIIQSNIQHHLLTESSLTIKTINNNCLNENLPKVYLRSL